jgi:hypothetical protein
MDRSHVLFLYSDGWHNIWLSVVRLVHTIKCKLVCNKVEDFLQNRNLQDIHINQFSEIASKCFNLKCYHLGLLYIPKTIDLKHLQIYTIHVTEIDTAYIYTVCERWIVVVWRMGEGAELVLLQD